MRERRLLVLLLLGLIIEQLSGASYGDYIGGHVTGPLGLEHTRLLDPKSIIPRRARSYAFDSSRRFVNAQSWGTYGVAAGGLGSTVTDLLRLGRRRETREDHLS